MALNLGKMGLNTAHHGSICIFLCGDVMTGRGIDQILPHPSNHEIHEPWVKDARKYVELAEQKNGQIPKPVDFSYIWGDALSEFEQMRPDLRIINLETSVTRSEEYWKGKEIHYRMSPENIPCITAAKVDCCSLANNHVLDWGYSGLRETLKVLNDTGIRCAGVGRNIDEAKSPAVLEVEGKGKVLVLSMGTETSGIPVDWAASKNKGGVNLLRDLSDETVSQVKERVASVKKQGDIVVVSIHWGANWGYRVSEEQHRFAHKLVEVAGVDVVHGHSSHHAKGMEVHRGKLILYGCGDFLNDYEGIGGYEEFRSDLCLMYFASVVTSTGQLASLDMVPMQIKRFRVNRAGEKDASWLGKTIGREVEKFGCGVETKRGNVLSLAWG